MPYPTPQKIGYTEYGDMLNPESTMVILELEISHYHMLRLAEKLLRLVNENRNDTHSTIIIGGYPQDDGSTTS
ncbi:hypothetical protein LCGC14_1456250 [marine sediment metagenome]|uniref:Uncharacterized protein n=1 Tax=marine sediment metagenome TaxID=412755 RepID=A0A0F9K2M1_9ZZZZ